MSPKKNRPRSWCIRKKKRPRGGIEDILRPQRGQAARSKKQGKKCAAHGEKYEVPSNLQNKQRNAAKTTGLGEAGQGMGRRRGKKLVMYQESTVGIFVSGRKPTTAGKGYRGGKWGTRKWLPHHSFEKEVISPHEKGRSEVFVI